MSEANFQELKELMLDLNKRMELGFSEVRGEFQQVRAEIKLVEERLTGKINQVEERLTGRVNQVEEKLTGIDKRLANEELVSRGVFIALVGGVITGLTKFFFFP
jgi:VIT1/CCC1 family predicted Fe2+/Mn2+ transporter